MPSTKSLQEGQSGSAQGRSGWTDEGIEILKTLWQEGLSSSQIARRLGVTRNAVIGKIHRMGLAARPTPPRVARAAQPKRAASHPIARGPRRVGSGEGRDACVGFDTAPLPELDEAPGAATVLTLGAHMCKWPIGDPSLESFTLCGRDAAGGPYCAHHARFAYQRARGRTGASPAEFARSLRRYL